MDDSFRDIMASWLSKDGIHSTADLLSWAADEKKRSKVCIERIPQMESKCRDKALFRSMTGTVSQHVLTDIYHRINNYKMYTDTETNLIRLDMLKDWTIIQVEEKQILKVLAEDQFLGSL